MESVLLEAFALRDLLVDRVACDMCGYGSVESGIKVRNGDGFRHLVDASLNHGERGSVMSTPPS